MRSLPVLCGHAVRYTMTSLPVIFHSTTRAEPQRITIDHPQNLIEQFAEIFPKRTQDEQERLVDAILREAVLERAVESE